MPTHRAAERVAPAPLLGAVAAAVAAVVAAIVATRSAAVAGIDDPGDAVVLGIPFVRLLLYGAAIATVGLCLLELLIRGERDGLAGPVLARARHAAVASSLVWATAAVVLLVLQTAEVQTAPGGVGLGDIAAYVGQGGPGAALLIVAALALAHAGLGVAGVRTGRWVPAEARTGLALLALLPPPAVGHASTGEHHAVILVSIELHVLAAVAWVGGLAGMATLLVGHRALLASAVPRFSVLATICLAATAGTGLIAGLVEIGQNPNHTTIHGLLYTGYGNLVLAKTVCLLALAAVGARLRYYLLPRMRAHGRTAFGGWAGLELAIMGLAIGFAVVLSRTALT